MRKVTIWRSRTTERIKARQTRQAFICNRRFKEQVPLAAHWSRGRGIRSDNAAYDPALFDDTLPTPGVPGEFTESYISTGYQDSNGYPLFLCHCCKGTVGYLIQCTTVMCTERRQMLMRQQGKSSIKLYLQLLSHPLLLLNGQRNLIFFYL